MIIVPTIPNTGTHFLLDLLGVQPKGMLWNYQVNGIEYGHIYPEWKRHFLPLIENNLTLIPLRHPFVVAKSWADRGGNPYEMIDMWDLLVDEIDPLNPVYLPIDSYVTRNGYLNALNIRTGLRLKTDWAPVGAVNGNHGLRHHELEPDELMVELVDRISGFLERFYPTKKSPG